MRLQLYALFLVVTALIWACDPGQEAYEREPVVFQSTHPENGSIRVQVLPEYDLIAFQYGDQAQIDFFDPQGTLVRSRTPTNPPVHTIGYYAWSPDSLVWITPSQMQVFGPHGYSHPVSLAGIFGAVLMDSQHPILALDDRIYFIANHPQMSMAGLNMVYRYNFSKEQTDALIAYPDHFTKPVQPVAVPAFTTDGNRLICAYRGESRLLIYDLQHRTEQVVTIAGEGMTSGIYFRPKHQNYYRILIPAGGEQLGLQQLRADFSVENQVMLLADGYDPLQAFVYEDVLYLRVKESAQPGIVFDRIKF